MHEHALICINGVILEWHFGCADHSNLSHHLVLHMPASYSYNVYTVASYVLL